MNLPDTDKNVSFAVMSVAVALLSAGIHAVTGEWPAEFGALGAGVFVVIAAGLLGVRARARRAEVDPSPQVQRGD